MNLSEFKAWFEGFAENMDGPPNAKSWDRIQKKIKSISAEPTEIRHIYHEWPHIYRRYWGPYLSGGNPNIAYSIASASNSSATLSVTDVFADIGREEAKSISAVR